MILSFHHIHLPMCSLKMFELSKKKTFTLDYRKKNIDVFILGL